MLLDLVKRGGKQEYTCDGCGKPIAKGEQYYRQQVKGGSKRYHLDCVPEKGKISTKNQPKAE
jgi:hypothetical protein